MPHWHRKFSIAMLIIATLSLPLLSVASVENTFKNASNSFIVFGAKIDKTIAFAVLFPGHAVRYTTDTIELSASALANIADLAYRQAGKQIQITNNHIQSLSLSFQRTLESSYEILHRIPNQVWDKVQDDTISYLSSVKEGLSPIASLIPQLRSGGKTLDVDKAAGGESFDAPRTSNAAKPAAVRYAQNAENQPLTIIERIIVKEMNHES